MLVLLICIPCTPFLGRSFGLESSFFLLDCLNVFKDYKISFRSVRMELWLEFIALPLVWRFFLLISIDSSKMIVFLGMKLLLMCILSAY